MDCRIEGAVMPMLHISLKEDEAIISKRGAMVWMDDNIEMHTHSHGGVGGGIQRMLAGESFFVTRFSAKGGAGSVSLGVSAPGKILDFRLSGKNELICQKNAFLAATEEVRLHSYIKKKLTVGFFGGEGFVLQKLSGKGRAFLEADGEIHEMELSSGQTIKVDTGCIAAFEGSVQYGIVRIRGVRNAFFGGEGFFMAKLTGPGRVYLQSMTISSLAEKLVPFLPFVKKSK